MWCENFMSTYRSTPANRLAQHYGDKSVLVETCGDERWTEPVSGASKIAARLASLGPAVNEWPVVACQRTRSNGLLVVMLATNQRDRQILVVHRYKEAMGGAVVCNHFYLTARREADPRHPPFYGRFERWAMSLDRDALHRHRAALYAGLSVVRAYYASTTDVARWRQYDPEARFSCTRNGTGGARAYVGPRSIRKRYGQLALDYGNLKSRAVETCWSVAPNAVAVLVAGTVPEVINSKIRVKREFVQFFVIETRTKKILNDILSIDDDGDDDEDDDDDTSSLGSSSSSYSAWREDYSQYASSDDVSSTKFGGHLRSPHRATAAWSTSSSMTTDGRTSAVDGRCSTSDDYDDDSADNDLKRATTDELIELRSRVTANVLKIQIGNEGGGGSKTGQPPKPINNINPRQLFIGCVPLHVKYGQLKLLFEQFGEVTFVKVYEGYSKQTGAKMMHNYAFLFFKDEASVERAIAASPVPLDPNWNLNVSRPHRHIAPAT